jgi:hypothetical protein
MKRPSPAFAQIAADQPVRQASPPPRCCAGEILPAVSRS